MIEDATNAEQEDLAEEIGLALATELGIYNSSWEEDMMIAKRLLDAGYRKVGGSE